MRKGTFTAKQNAIANPGDRYVGGAFNPPPLPPEIEARNRLALKWGRAGKLRWGLTLPEMLSDAEAEIKLAQERGATVKENLTTRHCLKCDRSADACRCEVPELVENQREGKP